MRMKVTMKLGEFIKQYRAEHGLSQRQFAIQCKMSNGYISMLEEGKRPKSEEPVVPTLNTLKKIASAMGMGMRDLINLVDDMPISIENNSVEAGARIRERRESLNMTQAELGLKVGYTSRSSINKVELGLVDLPQSKIVAIANALDVSISYIMGLKEKNEDTLPPVFLERGDTMGFQEQLKKARLQLGYTQQQVADLMEITKSTYCGYETGKRQPDVAKIKQLAKILNTSVDILIGTDACDKITIGARIKAARLNKGLSQDDVAQAINSTKQAVYKYENGIVTNIPMDKIEIIANLLGVTPAYLMGWEEKTEDTLPLDFASLEKYGIMPLPKMKKLPLLGTVACGEPILAEENIDGYCECPENIDADFCLRAKGDSMINARIFDGDVLFVHKQDIVEDGEVAAVLIEDEATVKRVYYDREEGTLTLVPENPKFKIMRFHGEQLNQIRIIGKVIAGRYEVK